MFSPSSLRRQRRLFLALAALLSVLGLQRGAETRSATAVASYQLMRISVLSGLRATMYGAVQRPDPLRVKLRGEGGAQPVDGGWLEGAVANDPAFESVEVDEHAVMLGRRLVRGGQVFVHLTLRRRNLSADESWDLSTPTSVGTLAWPALSILALVAAALVATRRRGSWLAPLVAGVLSQGLFWTGSAVVAMSGAGGGSVFSSMRGVGLGALAGELSAVGTMGLWLVLGLSCLGVLALRFGSRGSSRRPAFGRLLGLTACWGGGALAWLDVAIRTGALTRGDGVLGAMAWLSIAAGIGASLGLVARCEEST